MSDKRRLVFSIIQFCQEELQSDGLSDDAKESLEVMKKRPPKIPQKSLYFIFKKCPQVASQCLQSAYALNLEDKHLEVSQTLEKIFQEATKNEPVSL